MKLSLKALLALTLVVGSVSFFAGCATTKPEIDPIIPTSSEESNISSNEVIPIPERAPVVPTVIDKKYIAEDGTEVENPVATIEMEDGKKIEIELFPAYAPNTVKNFISLANSGFYDGVVFHRIMPNFMIQGGDPDGTGMGGPDYAIKGEFAQNGFTDNIISHTEGIMSMARANEPDSAGSQFFICDSNEATFLDGQYAAFGRVSAGLDLVKEIANDPANAELAITPRAMKTITIDSKGFEWGEPEKLVVPVFTNEAKEYINEDGVVVQNPVATIEMEDGQKIVVELYPSHAPNTVKNFIELSNSGFYDGVVFHRIVPNFMIQGGDPTGTGTGGPDHAIAGEFTGNGFMDNTLSHAEGTISMARSGDPNSAGSQFFICDADATFLDGQYAAFGRVIEGIDLVKEIVNDKASGEMAETPRVMKSITVDTFGYEWGEAEKTPAAR